MEKSFSDSRMTHLLFKLIAPVMESPLRYRFFNPVKCLKAGGIQTGQAVLEVGCGTGFFTIPAAGLVGIEGCVYAVDPHSLAIEQVAKKIQSAGLTNVSLIKCDATRCGLASGLIDLVLLYGVIPSPTLPLELLLPEMHRLLKSKGRLAVWTALPWWSPAVLTKNRLFAYIGKEKGVHTFRRTASD
jgi:ubiquinone/menaquinone biosynthesis C-methylase UbiE